MKNIIKELTWRGLIKDKANGIDIILKNPTTIYIGFDPTSDSLHIGSLLPIIIIIHFYKIGHNILIVIGGATANIGDPSYKKNKRSYINKKKLIININSIKKQINKLLNYYSINNIEILDNAKWIKEISLLKFLSELGEIFSINYLLSKKFIKNRINNGIFITELIYPLIQGYDFFYLNYIKNCNIQIGGSDQWGNITIGIDLIQKKTGKKTYGLTFPLITNSKGIKFGKSEKHGNIWLDKYKTTPYNFYQFFINIPDEEAKKYIKIYTFYSKKKIEKYIYIHENNPSIRYLQNKLAKIFTYWIHGKKTCNEIINVSSFLFNKKVHINYNENINNENILKNIYSYIPHKTFAHEIFKHGILLSKLLIESGFIIISKKKIINLIISKVIYLNKQKIKEDILITEKHLINQKYIILQNGKKNFFIIKTN